MSAAIAPWGGRRRSIPRKIGKTALALWDRQLADLFEAQGVETPPEEELHLGYKHRMLVAGGTLWLTQHPDSSTVFGRFDPPEAAPAWCDANPYTGKWNHHFPRAWFTVAAVRNMTAISQLGYNLRRVLDSAQETLRSQRGGDTPDC